MHGRKVADEAGMIAKPGLNQLPLMHFHIVQDQENAGVGTVLSSRLTTFSCSKKNGHVSSIYATSKREPLAQVIIKKAFRCSSEARLHKRCMLEEEEKKERFSMNNTLAALHPMRILGVFAHPDDESFCAGGTLARYVASGAEVMVVSATRGEAGQIRSAGVATRRTLGQVREQELSLKAGFSSVRRVPLENPFNNLYELQP